MHPEALHVAQELFEKPDKKSKDKKGLTWPLDQASVGSTEQTRLIHRGFTSHLTGLKGPDFNFWLTDSTAHLQKSSGVHASISQFCTIKAVLLYISLGSILDVHYTIIFNLYK